MIPFTSLPDEVLDVIAFHLATSTPAGHPPSALVPFIATCSLIHKKLSFKGNPHLYAHLFELTFDNAAPLRRLESNLVSATAFAAEYKLRILALRALRASVVSHDASLLAEKYIWTIYLMLMENDVKNQTLLLGDHDFGGPLRTYLGLYHSQYLIAQATRTGYPSADTSCALLLWIIWLTTTAESIMEEDPLQLEELLVVLRPYVFAAKHYDVTFASWTFPILPRREEMPSSSSTHDQQMLNPYMAITTLQSRAQVVEHYGAHLSICAPILSHAAILNFFARLDHSSKNSRRAVSNDALGRPPTADLVLATGMQLAGQHRTAPPGRFLSFTPANNSLHNDHDWSRLVKASDPFESPGFQVMQHRGSFEGCWEGNFSFVDFDMYRSMLSGSWSSLYEADFGEQSQVWRIHEVFVRGPQKLSTSMCSMTDPSGSTLNAGFPEGSSPFDKLLSTMKSQGLNTNSTSVAAAVVDLLEGRDRLQNIVDMLGGLDGKEIIPQEELEACAQKSSVTDTADVEMFLVGTGHSAWGDFVLRGRVRAWDGLMTLVKEYSPDGRGRWIYRGYLVGGAVLVGRWRDTFTPEVYAGYEGTFTLSRREDI